MEVVFHPSAGEELDASIEFYEARLEGLGGRFLAAVEEAIRRIARSPAVGSSLSGGFRKRIAPGSERAAREAAAAMLFERNARIAARADAGEGVASMLENRQPVFRGE
jgi:hypothetical protein